MGNNLWLSRSHGLCKECKKDVPFYEFRHIRKGDGRAIVIRVCSICFIVVDGHILNAMEALEVFPN